MLNEIAGVVRWRVDGVELERLLAGHHDLVLGAGVDQCKVVLEGVQLDAVLLVDQDVAGARLDADELGGVLVHLGRDALGRLDAHEHQLCLLAGVQHSAVVLVVQRECLDVAVRVGLGLVLQ